jgi:multiple sugar transport system permease protein
MPSTSLTIPLPPKPKSTWLAWLLIAPSIIMLLAVTVFPLFFALKNSFYFWNLQMGPQPLGFIGWGNYQMALTRDTFWVPLVNTVLLTVAGTVLEVVAGLAVAVLLFRYMYDPTGGLIPWLLRSLHFPLPAEGLLGSSWTALPAILFADFWQWTPFCAIVFYSALLAVPQGLLEAAKLDGAGAWETFRRIKLPMIRNTIAVVVMLRFMQLFNTFDLVLVLTRGGPGSSSRTLGYSLYQTGLVDFNIGQASAMTWMIVLIVNVIIVSYAAVAFRNWE